MPDSHDLDTRSNGFETAVPALDVCPSRTAARVVGVSPRFAAAVSTLCVALSRLLSVECARRQLC